jgi:MFS superfamily sulfate permease-like transporter
MYAVYKSRRSRCWHVHRVVVVVVVVFAIAIAIAIAIAVAHIFILFISLQIPPLQVSAFKDKAKDVKYSRR